MTGPNFEPAAHLTPVSPRSGAVAASTGSIDSEESSEDSQGSSGVMGSIGLHGSFVHLHGWTAAYATLHHAGVAEFPPACLHYILNVVRHAARRGKASHTLSAPEVIAAFRTTSRKDFGALHDAVLEDWGLRTPADLGRAVSLLGRVGCLTLDDGDAPRFYSDDALPLVTAPHGALPVATLGEQEAP